MGEDDMKIVLAKKRRIAGNAPTVANWQLTDGGFIQDHSQLTDID